MLGFVALAVRVGRSPCGERGLKSCVLDSKHADIRSLPVRGAWIEIYNELVALVNKYGRSPCGERGLKCYTVCVQLTPEKVAPRAGSVD